MRRDAFKTYLMSVYVSRHGEPLPEASANSYCTYVAQAEELLRRDLHGMDPDEQDLASVISALRSAASRAGTAAGTLNNAQSGVRAYAGFLRHTRARAS